MNNTLKINNHNRRVAKELSIILNVEVEYKYKHTKHKDLYELYSGMWVVQSESKIGTFKIQGERKVNPHSTEITIYNIATTIKSKELCKLNIDEVIDELSKKIQQTDSTNDRIYFQFHIDHYLKPKQEEKLKRHKI